METKNSNIEANKIIKLFLMSDLLLQSQTDSCIFLTSCHKKSKLSLLFGRIHQRWSRGHKARGQGHKKISRPRTDPLEAKAKDQGHRRQVFSKKKSSSKIVFRQKRPSEIFFRRSLLEETKQKVFADFPQGFWRFPTKFQRFKNSAVLEPRTGQFSRT